MLDLAHRALSLLAFLHDDPTMSTHERVKVMQLQAEEATILTGGQVIAVQEMGRMCELIDIVHSLIDSAPV